MYNNPNFYGFQPMYYSNISQKTGLLSKLKGGINWGNFLTNTSKTLNVINQAIPLFYQVRPLFQNAKTMFRIADIIRSDNTQKKSTINQINTSVANQSQEEIQNKTKISNNQPTFFL